MLHRATRMRTNQYLPGMHGLSGLEAMCGHCNPWCVPVISQKLDPPKGCALFILYHPSYTKSHKTSNQTIHESNPGAKKWSGIGGILKSDQIPHTCLLWENSDTPDAGYSSMSSEYQAKRSGRQCTSQAERIWSQSKAFLPKWEPDRPVHCSALHCSALRGLFILRIASEHDWPGVSYFGFLGALRKQFKSLNICTPSNRKFGINKVIIPEGGQRNEKRGMYLHRLGFRLGWMWKLELFSGFLWNEKHIWIIRTKYQQISE